MLLFHFFSLFLIFFFLFIKDDIEELLLGEVQECHFKFELDDDVEEIRIVGLNDNLL